MRRRRLSAEASAGPAVQAKPEVSYEQVKRLALAAPGVNCKKTEDQKLGPVLRGEIYKRLSCDGKGIVDYVVGQAAVDTQFGPARRINPRDPLWRGRQGPTLVRWRWNRPLGCVPFRRPSAGAVAAGRLWRR